MSHVMKALVQVQRHQQLSLVRLMCNYGKELVRPSGPDFLLQNLKTAHSAHNVLEIVATHHKIMNSKHSMQALRSLFELQKNEKTGVSMKEILRHPSFIQLCKKLKAQAGVIELNESIEALKVMSFVGVPSDSIISQVLLQLVRHNINALSLNHIMFLDFLLGQFKKSPLVEALKIALPLVFEINLPLKIDRDNLGHMTDYLYYAARTKLSKDTVELIVKSLCNYNYEYDMKSAKSIIWSICDMESNELVKPLLDKALCDFIVHLEDVDFSDIEITLSKLVYKYSSKYPFYYNEIFCDTVANYVLDHDLGFQNAMYLLRKFIRTHHWNKYILDYVCKKLIEDNSLIVDDPINVYSLTLAISVTDYRPKDWDAIAHLITEQKNLATSLNKHQVWIKFGAGLCLLNIFKLDVLSKCLNETYLGSIFRKDKVFMSDIESYLAVWYCINLYKKEYVDLLPSKYTPEMILDVMHEIEEFPLEGALQKGLGGEKYLMTDLVSKLGHQIDHAVLFRKGGFPVAVQNNGSRFIEDIEIPPDHHLLCIFVTKPIHHTINTKVLRSSISISHKMLEETISNTCALPVSLEIWENLPDFEKIPFLMQNIKDKMQCDSSLTESVMM